MIPSVADIGCVMPDVMPSRFLNDEVMDMKGLLEKYEAVAIASGGSGEGAAHARPAGDTEIARTLVLGRASNELQDAFAAVKEAQSHTLSLLKPGVSGSDIAAGYDAYMQARGLPPETRLYSHGQCYDMVEQPLIRRDETMRLAERMCLAAHPGYQTELVFAVIRDNYMIGLDGPGECLRHTTKRLFEV